MAEAITRVREAADSALERYGARETFSCRVQADEMTVAVEITSRTGDAYRRVTRFSRDAEAELVGALVDKLVRRAVRKRPR